MQPISQSASSGFACANSAHSLPLPGSLVDVIEHCLCGVLVAALTSGRVIPRVPSLRNLIGCIRLVRTEKQMGRIQARRIVAMVADNRAARDRADESFISETMSQRLFAVEHDSTVSGMVFQAGPLPTTVVTIDDDSAANSRVHARTKTKVPDRSQFSIDAPLLLMCRAFIASAMWLLVAARKDTGFHGRESCSI